MLLGNPTIPVVAALALVCTGVACSSATQRSGGPQSRAVLLADEIQAATGLNTAHDAIVRLRPEWLHRRGPISVNDPTAGELVVYVNGMRHGRLDYLQTIRVEMVEQMEYLDASDATTRFGTGHGGGAIVVLTR